MSSLVLRKEEEEKLYKLRPANKAFKTHQSNVCPVELAAQFEAFRALMGPQPAHMPEQADLLGTSVWAADASCLNASMIITG